MPAASVNFGDLLDPRFQDIFDEEFNQPRDMLGELYTMPPTNNRNNMTWSQVGTLGDFTEFSGTVGYQDVFQGYDTTSTPIQWTNGFQVERALFDDDQHNVMDSRARALGAAAFRTRQKHGARFLNNAFSVDNFFYNNSEGVALCSDSHTTTAGASTATGFDNLGTAALTATAVQSNRILMRKFRGDQGNIIDVTPDEFWIPIDLEEEAFEIVKALGQLDTANNNPNVHEGRYTIKEWHYLTDTNNWWMTDSSLRRQMAFWVERKSVEFGQIEDFDTLVAKWRAYMRYSNAHVDWRWVFGAQVS